VQGTSTFGTGVNGTSSTGTAVSGTSASTAANVAAMVGVISSASPGSFSAAVLGQNNGTGGNGIGVYGLHNGSGYGVFGFAPGGYGLFGESTTGYGLVASTLSGTGTYSSSGHGIGVDAYSSSNTAVRGISDSTSASAVAIEGVISSTNPGPSSAAVLGQNNGTGNSGIGVWGQQNGSGYGVYGGAPSGYGVVGSSTTGTGVWGQSDIVYGVYGTSTNGIGVVGSGLAYGLFAYGNTGATGTKSALVPAENGIHRTLYCLESPECWFEDFGSATLTKGSATVTIDPLFAATVDSSQYHIFLAPEGESNGLYVSAKSGAGFTVREQQGGTSSLAFSYRIVARRKDVAAPRLAPITLPSQKALQQPPALAAQRPAVIPPARLAPTGASPSAAQHNQGSGASAAVATPVAPPIPPMLPTPADPSLPQA
jgi:hypothetical protein